LNNLDKEEMNKQEELRLKDTIMRLEGSIKHLESIHPDLISANDYNKLEEGRGRLYELHLHLEHGVALLPVEDLPVLTHPDRQAHVVHHHQEEDKMENTVVEEVLSQFFIIVTFDKEWPTPYIDTFFVSKNGTRYVGHCSSSKNKMSCNSNMTIIGDQCDYWLKRM
jgi:hypothetical protein